MISHVHVGISDFDRALAFYRPVMAALGLNLRFQDPQKGWAGCMQPHLPRPLFLIGRPFDGGPADPGRGQMVALLAADRATVDRCHATALAAGGMSEGAPGLRPQYHADFYGAYIRDPDGNKLCVCCHTAEEDPTD